jgi:hypothetical protein
MVLTQVQEAQQREEHKQRLLPVLNALLGKLTRLDAANQHIFAELVSRAALPRYYELIETPMALSIMRTRLAATANAYTNANATTYVTLDAFCADLKIMLDNCLFFNAPGTIYAQAALRMRMRARVWVQQARAALLPGASATTSRAANLDDLSDAASGNDDGDDDDDDDVNMQDATMKKKKTKKKTRKTAPKRKSTELKQQQQQPASRSRSRSRSPTPQRQQQQQQQQQQKKKKKKKQQQPEKKKVAVLPRVVYTSKKQAPKRPIATSTMSAAALATAAKVLGKRRAAELSMTEQQIAKRIKRYVPSKPFGRIPGMALDFSASRKYYRAKNEGPRRTLAASLTLWTREHEVELSTGFSLFLRDRHDMRCDTRFGPLVDAAGGDCALVRDTGTLPDGKTNMAEPARVSSKATFDAYCDSMRAFTASCDNAAVRDAVEQRIARMRSGAELLAIAAQPHVTSLDDETFTPTMESLAHVRVPTSPRAVTTTEPYGCPPTETTQVMEFARVLLKELKKATR